MRRLVCAGFTLMVFALVQVGCAPASQSAETAGTGPNECVGIVVQNQGHAGVSVSVAWENRSPRRLGRVGVSERRVFTLPYQNNPLSLRLQAEGGTTVTVTNSLLPTPGVLLSVTYYVNQAGPLRRGGSARCP